jgi:hypothetical protein
LPTPSGPESSSVCAMRPLAAISVRAVTTVELPKKLSKTKKYHFDILPSAMIR